MAALVLVVAVILVILWFALSPLFGKIGNALSNKWSNLFDEKDKEEKK